MGSSFRHKSAHHADIKGKGILYEDDDDTPIKLVDRDDSFAIKEFGLTLIGKVLNPKKQNVEKLLQTMPSQWGLAERITANDLGNGKFLFNFTNEEDLNYVMAKGPFHYNFCMIVLVRWEPIVHDDYPWIIPFWVQLIGFPLHLWTDTNLKNIGRRIGHIDTIELTEGRMLIDVDSRRPLKFSRKVEYEGDEVTIEIKYDKLFKHCATCGMLSHEKAHCPYIETGQSSVDHSDVFARMQLPARQNDRDNQGTDRNNHQSSLMRREMYSRNYRAAGARPDLRSRLRESHNNYPRSRENDRRAGSHAERIIRRRDEYKRSDRYGGGRARSGPYDRKDGQSWRAKAKQVNITNVEQNDGEVIVRNNVMVPYEHLSSAEPLSSLSIGNDLLHSKEHKENSFGTRKLASTIVTPSRLGSTDNVTVRSRAVDVIEGRNLTFSPLGKEPMDEQIIGALSDMELVEQQGNESMETDVNDDDLLGVELMEMEGDDSWKADRVIDDVTKAKGSNDVKRTVKHKKLGVRRGVPLGSSSRKFEILRRGSPSKRTARSESLVSEKADKSRRYRSGSKKESNSTRCGGSKRDGSMSSKNSSHRYQ